MAEVPAAKRPALGPSAPPRWQMASYKGKQVFVLVRGSTLPRVGVVQMRYSLKNGSALYSLHADKLEHASAGSAPKTGGGGGTKAKKTSNEHKAAAAALILKLESQPNKVVIVATDGACTGNPGPAGAGAVLKHPDNKTTIEKLKPLGHGTNQIAELEGIGLALDLATEAKLDGLKLAVLTDSAYALGMLQPGSKWKAKENVELVRSLRARIAQRKAGVEIHKVKAHCGVPMNERADALAGRAVGMCGGANPMKRKRE